MQHEDHDILDELGWFGGFALASPNEKLGTSEPSQMMKQLIQILGGKKLDISSLKPEIPQKTWMFW